MCSPASLKLQRTGDFGTRAKWVRFFYFSALFQSHMSQDDLTQRIEAMVEPIAEELGLEVHDVEVRIQQDGLVRVVLDRKGATGPGTGVTIGELGEVTRQLDYLLDVEDFISFAYRLEVTSPGIERDLTRPAHYTRYIGEEVRLVLRAPTEDRQNVLRGKLVAFDGLTIEIHCEDGVTRSTTFDAVKKAKTVYDFDAQNPAPKKGKGAKSNDSGKNG